MRVATFTAISFAVITGCTSTPPETAVATQTHLPDGRTGHSIQCSGSMSGCYEKAGEICQGRGYEVATQQQSKKSAIGFTGAKSQIIYDVLIACKR